MSRGYRLLFVFLVALIINYLWADIPEFSLNDFICPPSPSLRRDSPESFRSWRQRDYAPASASDNMPGLWIFASTLSALEARGFEPLTSSLQSWRSTN
jgi:hypothetical protein